MKTLFKSLVGSRAYGVYHEGSDYDYRGVYLYPLKSYLGLDKIKDSKTQQGDTVYYEVTNFLRMCVNANPNILEVLFSPFKESISDYGQEIIDKRDSFLTQKVYYNYRGYYKSEYANQKNGAKSRYHVIRVQVLLRHFLKYGVIKITIPEDMVTPITQIKSGEGEKETFYYYYNMLEEDIHYYWSIYKKDIPEQVNITPINKLLREIKLSYDD